MSAGGGASGGADLATGVPIAGLPEGKPVQGHFDGDAVILIRRGAELFAVGATCTHHGAPLAEGLVVGDEVRCPWHHASFSIRTGEALGPPALNPLPRYSTVVEGGLVKVTKRLAPAASGAARANDAARRVVILGAGAAGSAAAETLRRERFGGTVVLIDPDPDAPYDRTNLSKDYLAGSAPDEWLPLRPPGLFAELGIERIVAGAVAIDPRARRVRLSDGASVGYDALILATGSAAIRPSIPGASQRHVHVLRSLDDCRAIIRNAGHALRAVVAGTSFIGMEAAAALRSRGLDVLVVGPDATPFERTLGPELGAMFRGLHEMHGVNFHLGRTIASIDLDRVTMDDGSVWGADLVLLGVGVRPNTGLAETAGVRVRDGVLVDDQLCTSDPRIYAVGDIARFPSPFAPEPIRVEHWAVAQRQGQTAARNVLGSGEPFRSVPFFWSRQYDVSVSFIGYAGPSAERRLSGEPSAGDCRIDYVEDGRTVAVATVGRDRESLEAEVALEGALQRTTLTDRRTVALEASA